MKPREKIRKAFAFEEVRPTPYSVWYDHETMLRLDKYYGGNAWQARFDDAILRLIIDWEPQEPIDENHYRDVHGSVWKRGETPHIIRPVLEKPRLEGFSIPDYTPFLHQAVTPPENIHEPLPKLGFNDARALIEKEKANKIVIVQFSCGLFECSWMIRGFEDLFVDLLKNPSFCHDLYDMLLERHLQLVDELLKLGADGIIFVDDYGDQRGVLIGPDLWRQFIKPRLAKLYERVQQSGKWAFQHTCGNVFDIIPDFIDIGLDVLQSLQPEAMPVYEIKQHFGNELCLWGGLGTQQLLPKGTPEEIRAEIRRLRRELGRGGGYCFSSSKPLMKDVPVENAVAFIEETLNPTPYEC